MKILLLKDVKKVGQKGQVVEVAEGYGRNFLIKNGFGKTAVGGVLKEVQNKKINQENSQEEKVKKELELLGAVNKKRFILKANASEKGHLFAAIHKKEIAELTGIKENNIVLEKDIKDLGEFVVNIKLGGKKGKIILIVESK